MTIHQKRVRTRKYPDWFDQCEGYYDRLTTKHNSFPFNTTVEERKGNLTYAGGFPVGQQYTADENHISELKDFKHFEFHGDAGGEFFMQRSGVLADGHRQHLFGKGNNSSGDTETHEYWGPVYAVNPANVALPATQTLRNLDTLGTTAINRVKPTNNVANLATDLVELRQEGLPKIIGAHTWEAKTLRAQEAGGEYLNYQFGWLPLVSDIRDSAYAAANAHKIISAYERNSHKLVRRRYEFPVEKSQTVTTYLSNSDGVIPSQITTKQLFNRPGTGSSIIQIDRFYRRTWFSGAFTYHLPPGWNSRIWVADAAAKAGPLLGIELTPEVVWNATPWTWAIDWFSNVGDLVGNYSDMSVDGLVIKYGYLMEHTVTSRQYVFNGKCRLGDFPCDAHPSSVTAFVETKRRAKATPFGFGLAWDGLTVRQLAIAAALGLTRFARL